MFLTNYDLWTFNYTGFITITVSIRILSGTYSFRVRFSIPDIWTELDWIESAKTDPCPTVSWLVMKCSQTTVLRIISQPLYFPNRCTLVFLIFCWKKILLRPARLPFQRTSTRTVCGMHRQVPLCLVEIRCRNISRWNSSVAFSNTGGGSVARRWC